MGRPPLPPDHTIEQSAVIAGQRIHYKVTIGTIAIRDETGKAIGQVVYTSYMVPGHGAARPVTFAFDGGPGGSSVTLNIGGIGPKRLQFGAPGDTGSDAPVLRDNPASWIGFTDLVFIDPIGTGYSRSLVDTEGTRKAFYGNDQDVHYLSRVVSDWLIQAHRLPSPKYLLGKSYGGYRVPRIARELQDRVGVGLAGIVLISPYLDPAAATQSSALSPLPRMAELPAMAAAKLEREGRLTPTAMAAVEAYTRGDYLHDLMSGRSDPNAHARLVQHVAALTGLDTAFVERLDGRVDAASYLREIARDQGKIASRDDPAVTLPDPFPGSSSSRAMDPLYDIAIAPLTSAMVDFYSRQAGWIVDAPYKTLADDVEDAWEEGAPSDAPVSDLRKVLASDPKVRVLIAHGWSDLSCPYFLSRLIVDQLPAWADARVRLDIYPGGHMFYSRLQSAIAFKQDAEKLYRS
ncbi:S10 family peptidase [Sphingomonas sp.]|uniref:S10 family peptidase n=1 Tax=Sphingomonas sp. TaxID=28214 RepID=UPI003B3B52D0